MELEQFITKTLIDIVNGVKNANKDFEDREKFDLMAKEEIAFDIAIAVTKENSKSGAGGIKVLSFELGGGKDNSILNENISRVKFKVRPYDSIH